MRTGPGVGGPAGGGLFAEELGYPTYSFADIVRTAIGQ